MSGGPWSWGPGTLTRILPPQEQGAQKPQGQALGNPDPSSPSHDLLWRQARISRVESLHLRHLWAGVLPKTALCVLVWRWGAQGTQMPPAYLPDCPCFSLLMPSASPLPQGLPAWPTATSLQPDPSSHNYLINQTSCSQRQGAPRNLAPGRAQRGTKGDCDWLQR